MLFCCYICLQVFTNRSRRWSGRYEWMTVIVCMFAKIFPPGSSLLVKIFILSNLVSYYKYNCLLQNFSRYSDSVFLIKYFIVSSHWNFSGLYICAKWHLTGRNSLSTYLYLVYYAYTYVMNTIKDRVLCDKQKFYSQWAESCKWD